MPTSGERQSDRKLWWSIHDRDTYVCPDCGRTKAQHGKPWEVHHIDGVAGNVVAICEPCHDIRHGAAPPKVDLEAWKAALLGDDTDDRREDRSEARTSFTDTYRVL